MIVFCMGIKDRLETLSLDPDEYLKETKFQQELSLLIDKKNVYSSDTEIMSSALKESHSLQLLMQPL